MEVKDLKLLEDARSFRESLAPTTRRQVAELNMFGFGQRLSVDEKSKEWIDAGFQRLSMLFGKDKTLKTEVILPIDKYFADKYEKNEAGLETLFQRVCAFMEVERTKVELVMIPDHSAGLRETMPYWSDHHSGAAGLYDSGSEADIPTVALRETLAADPMAAVAVMAHELAHVILLGEKLIDRDSKDMEQMTDLATVFLGMGIFTANVAFRYEKHSTYRTEGWSVSKTGYLSEEMFGYALAKFAFERKESQPAWANYLSSNIHSHFKRSLKWLTKEQKR
jgi:hypothetical protein